METGGEEFDSLIPDQMFRNTCIRPDYCDSCNQFIDDTTCHCGDSYDNHEYSHMFVPSGCLCGYLDNRAKLYCWQPTSATCETEAP